MDRIAERSALHKKRPAGHIHQQQRAAGQCTWYRPRFTEAPGPSPPDPEARLHDAGAGSCNCGHLAYMYIHMRAHALVRIRMRMLYEPVTARAPALQQLPLQFRTRLLAPQKNPNARARALWDRHRACCVPDPEGPAPTDAGAMIITTGITGMSARPWKAEFLRLP